MKKKNPVIRTLKYVLPHWYLIVGSTLGGVIKLTLPLIIPQVVKYFTDELLVSTNPMTTAEKVTEIYGWLFFLLFYLFSYTYPQLL